MMKNAIQTLDRYSHWIIGAVLIVGCFYFFSPNQSDARKIEPSTDAVFQEVVAKETRPVLVKFGATWCPPCRSTDTALAKYEETSSGEVKVVILDVDTNPALSKHYQVSSIPHLFLFHHGKVIDERVGGMGTADIRGWLKANESQWKN